MSLGPGKTRSLTCSSNPSLHTKLSHTDTNTRPTPAQQVPQLRKGLLGTSWKDGKAQSMGWKNTINGGQFVLIFVFSSVYSSEFRTSFMTKNHRTKRNMTGQSFSIKNVFCLNHFFSNTNTHIKSCVIKKRVYYVLYATTWPSYSYNIYKCGCHHVCLYDKKVVHSHQIRCISDISIRK
jgi:hypothetical protein